MRLLVTGSAGFIGYHLAKARLDAGDTVIGLDNYINLALILKLIDMIIIPVTNYNAREITSALIRMF